MTDECSDGSEPDGFDPDESEVVDPTDYYDVLAPLPENLPWNELDALSELLAGVYDQGDELSYHDYALRNLGSPGVGDAWGVAPSDGGDEFFVAVVNLTGFRDVTELQAYLDELVAIAPESRVEWAEHRRTNRIAELGL